MKSVLVAAILTLAPAAFALDGQPSIHDPSSVIECDGRYTLSAQEVED